MFQLEEITKAHSKVKSGADFPAYVQQLKILGVEKYDSFVRDGHTIYFGTGNFQVQSAPKYPVLAVAGISDPHNFKHCLKIHQQGQTDYPTFCRHSAESGVEKWTVDMKLMTCTYYDTSGNPMLEEKIPN